MTKKRVLASKPTVVRDHFLSHGLGLMFRKAFSDQGMLFIFNIENNKHLHTMFLRFPIDMIFLDESKKVTKVLKDVHPWRLGISGHAKYVLELPAGRVKDTSVGDTISFK